MKLSKDRLLVAATSVESGRFRETEVPASTRSLTELLDQLVEVGQGYVEVRSKDEDFPMISMGFRGESALLHRASSLDHMSLLRGDGSIPPACTAEVLIMDELGLFTGEFVLDVQSARAALLRFAEGTPAEELGEWEEL